MPGIYDMKDPEDRYYSRQLDKYLDEQEAEDIPADFAMTFEKAQACFLEEYLDWVMDNNPELETEYLADPNKFEWWLSEYYPNVELLT